MEREMIFKILGGNIQIGHHIRENQSINAESSNYVACRTIRHPSPFCEFQSCKDKRMIMNITHLMYECSHEPFVKAREAIIETTKVQIERSKKIKTPDKIIIIQNLRAWWQCENYLIYEHKEQIDKIIEVEQIPNHTMIINDDYEPESQEEEELDPEEQSGKHDFTKLTTLMMQQGHDPEEIQLRLEIVQKEREKNYKNKRRNSAPIAQKKVVATQTNNKVVKEKEKAETEREKKEREKDDIPERKNKKGKEKEADKKLKEKKDKNNKEKEKIFPGNGNQLIPDGKRKRLEEDNEQENRKEKKKKTESHEREKNKEVEIYEKEVIVREQGKITMINHWENNKITLECVDVTKKRKRENRLNVKTFYNSGYRGLVIIHNDLITKYLVLTEALYNYGMQVYSDMLLYIFKDFLMIEMFMRPHIYRTEETRKYNINDNPHNNCKRIRHNNPLLNNHEINKINISQINLISSEITTQMNINVRNEALHALQQGKIRGRAKKSTMDIDLKLRSRGIVTNKQKMMIADIVKIPLDKEKKLNKVIQILNREYVRGMISVIKIYKEENVKEREKEGVNIKRRYPRAVRKKPPDKPMETVRT